MTVEFYQYGENNQANFGAWMTGNHLRREAHLK